MSDHDAVSFEVLSSLEKHKIQRRKIFQFHKADKDGIISEMHEFCETFFEHYPYRRTIQDNWHLFKTSIIDIIEKFVPTKVIKPHKNVPWLNQFIKQKMRLRNKLYVHAKCTQVGSDWSTYTLLKRGVTGTPIVKVFMYTHGIYNTLGEYCSTWGVVEHHKCHFTPQ